MWWLTLIAIFNCLLNASMMSFCGYAMREKKDFWGMVGCVWMFFSYILAAVCLYIYLRAS